ncbi:hypothetical protein LAZ67_5000148 [Cordylochernes scorpioides]|uniref:BTB domain-containing protein n=1 Tax=Cordylochernes scorpioides TaxID=51811 RepID=A0ABY6KFG0_9ARAC|nr:hypothetical protein LAZ67_5000148 [Cordylochernes scorpioides]
MQKRCQSDSSVKCKESQPSSSQVSSSLVVEGRLDPTSSSTSFSSHYAKLGQHAVQLWVQSHMTDILVRVGPRTFQAHKAVLTCYCPFFKKNLLNPDRSEIQGSSTKERYTTHRHDGQNQTIRTSQFGFLTNISVPFYQL